MIKINGLALATGAVLLWSTNAVGAKFALAELQVQQVQFLQFLGATFVFLLIKRFSQDHTKRKKLSLAGFCLGVIGLPGTMVFQYLAFNAGPLVEVNLIAYSWPLLTAIMVISLKDTAHPVFLLLLALIGFIGSTLVIGFSGIDFLQMKYGWGFVMAILSALCMAIYTVGTAKINLSPQSVLVPAGLVGLAGTLVWCWAGNPEWTSLPHILAGLYLGIGPMGFGYLLWASALRSDGAGRIAILGYLTPLSSTTLLWSFGETLELPVFVGGVLIVTSCVMIAIYSPPAVKVDHV